jgi:hypothetical protein
VALKIMEHNGPLFVRRPVCPAPTASEVIFQVLEDRLLVIDVRVESRRSGTPQRSPRRPLRCGRCERATRT